MSTLAWILILTIILTIIGVFIYATMTKKICAALPLAHDSPALRYPLEFNRVSAVVYGKYMSDMLPDKNDVDMCVDMVRSGAFEKMQEFLQETDGGCKTSIHGSDLFPEEFRSNRDASIIASIDAVMKSVTLQEIKQSKINYEALS